jgi:organic hydroperoxide reductase OsmC/OhrA
MSDLEFPVTATWDPEAGRGQLSTRTGGLCAHGGAESLGGKGGAPNPEELLAAAVSSCFVQTWAIFLAKLRLPYERPSVSARTTIEKDPAGGFRVASITVSPKVPAELWESRRTDVEKTLQLAEKYCIISKAVKGETAVLVEPQTAAQ